MLLKIAYVYWFACISMLVISVIVGLYTSVCDLIDGVFDGDDN